MDANKRTGHYFPFYPGDYLRDTGELSLEENGAYVILLAHYYAAEGLPADRSRLYRMCRATSESERAAVDFVVGRYFQENGGRILNRRAEEELGKRREFLEGQRRKSALGVEARALAREAELEALGAMEQEEREPEVVPAAKKKRLTKDYKKLIQEGTEFSTEDIAGFEEAYPAVVVREEIVRARMWLLANPANRKKNIRRFVTNWLARSQERAPRKGKGPGPGYSEPRGFQAIRDLRGKEGRE